MDVGIKLCNIFQVFRKVSGPKHLKRQSYHLSLIIILHRFYCVTSLLDPLNN